MGSQFLVCAARQLCTIRPSAYAEASEVHEPVVGPDPAQVAAAFDVERPKVEVWEGLVERAARRVADLGDRQHAVAVAVEDVKASPAAVENGLECVLAQEALHHVGLRRRGGTLLRERERGKRERDGEKRAIDGERPAMGCVDR